MIQKALSNVMLLKNVKVAGFGLMLPRYGNSEIERCYFFDQVYCILIGFTVLTQALCCDALRECKGDIRSRRATPFIKGGFA